MAFHKITGEVEGMLSKPVDADLTDLHEYQQRSASKYSPKRQNSREKSTPNSPATPPTDAKTPPTAEPKVPKLILKLPKKPDPPKKKIYRSALAWERFRNRLKYPAIKQSVSEAIRLMDATEKNLSEFGLHESDANVLLVRQCAPARVRLLDVAFAVKRARQNSDSSDALIVLSSDSSLPNIPRSMTSSDDDETQRKSQTKTLPTGFEQSYLKFIDRVRPMTMPPRPDQHHAGGKEADADARGKSAEQTPTTVATSTPVSGTANMTSPPSTATSPAGAPKTHATTSYRPILPKPPASQTMVLLPIPATSTPLQVRTTSASDSLKKPLAEISPVLTRVKADLVQNQQKRRAARRAESVTSPRAAAVDPTAGLPKDRMLSAAECTERIESLEKSLNLSKRKATQQRRKQTARKSIQVKTTETMSTLQLPSAPAPLPASTKIRIVASETGFTVKPTVTQQSQGFRCLHCAYTCTGRSVMIDHVYNHTDVIQYKCGHCGASFGAKNGLLSHLKRDHPHQERSIVKNPIKDVERYFCSIEDFNKKRTPPRSSPASHSDVSDDPKNSSSSVTSSKVEEMTSPRFSCKFCSFRSETEEAMRAHVEQRHSKQRQYVCPYCKVSFYKHIDTLKKHIIKWHKTHDFSQINLAVGYTVSLPSPDPVVAGVKRKLGKGEAAGEGEAKSRRVELTVGPDGDKTLDENQTETSADVSGQYCDCFFLTLNASNVIIFPLFCRPGDTKHVSGVVPEQGSVEHVRGRRRFD